MAENIIHTFKFYYFDVPSTDVMHEVVSFLYMNMHKFTEGKGKAFSYFSIVAKNYLILHNNNNYKKMKQTDSEEVTDYKRDPLSVEKRANIENFNKKALYIMIREMTNSNTQHITRVVNVMKKHHFNLQRNYLTTGSIETKWTGSWDNL